MQDHIRRAGFRSHNQITSANHTGENLIKKAFRLPVGHNDHLRGVIHGGHATLSHTHRAIQPATVKLTMGLSMTNLLGTFVYQ